MYKYDRCTFIDRFPLMFHNAIHPLIFIWPISPLLCLSSRTHPALIVSAIKTYHLIKCCFGCWNFLFLLKSSKCHFSFVIIYICARCSHSVNMYALDYAINTFTEGRNYTKSVPPLFPLVFSVFLLWIECHYDLLKNAIMIFFLQLGYTNDSLKWLHVNVRWRYLKITIHVSRN